MKTLLAALVTAAVVAGAGLFWFGAYDISASDQHLAPTYWLLDTAMRRSVKARARAIEVPVLEDEALVRRGGAYFRDHCVQCHGGPGVPPEPFALGLTPAPANLVHTAREWTPADMYWVVREGIKMTGMPAWRYRMSDDDIWSLVAFLRVLPTLSPEAYRKFVAQAGPSAPVEASERAGKTEAPDAARGKRAINQHLCVTCHVIPGIVGSNAPVGPPLDGMASRQFIAGVLPNTRENMVRWLREPQAISPHNAMPDLGLTERDAADIAAYLQTLR
jgi:mono/diheme cytochrome c family protein